MIAAIELAFSTVFYAAAASAAAPILIHLILRTKPRKIVFPAMRFVLKTHRSTLKMLRLKHLLLLLLRMAALVLAGLLIARATIPAWATLEDRSVPTAVAIVIDNSGSMNYRYHDQALLALARQHAQKLIESLPKGSRVAVLPAAGDRSATFLDPSLASQQVADLPATFSHAGVAPGLLQGTELLRRSDLPRKELCLLTDLTAMSWRDEVHLAPEKNVHYSILKCGGENVNVMLGDVKLSAGAMVVGSDVQVETSLSSAGIGGDMVVEVEVDGEAVWQQTVPLPAGGTAPVLAAPFTLKREGVVHGKVVLRNPDPLDMDNVRHFTLLVGRPIRVLVPAVNQTAFLIGAALAPRRSSSAGIQRETIAAEQLDAGRLAGVRVVLLPDVPALSEAQWKLLEPFVRAGGALWVVAGPMVSPDSYNTPAAQVVMPAALGAMEELAEPQHWVVVDHTHPMLQPFEGGRNAPLSDVWGRSRLRLASGAADARVLVEYQDKVPAILLRRVGEGTVVFWNLSPLQENSNLARLRTGQATILATKTVAELTAEPDAQTSYSYGQTVAIPLPRSMPNAVAAFRNPSSKADQPLMTDMRGGVVTIPAVELGSYDVRFAEAGRKVERGFSVNAEAAESDLRPMDAAGLTPMFPPGLLVTSDVSQIAQRNTVVTRPLDLAPLLLLALLAVMTGESFFANRFYRRADTPTST